MSTAAPGPMPYRVVYAERGRQRLLALADAARQRGDGEAFLKALKEFHRRLGLPIWRALGRFNAGIGPSLDRDRSPPRDALRGL